MAQPTYQDLVKENRHLREHLAEKDRQIAQLEARVVQLEARVIQLE